MSVSGEAIAHIGLKNQRFPTSAWKRIPSSFCWLDYQLKILIVCFPVLSLHICFDIPWLYNIPTEKVNKKNWVDLHTLNTLNLRIMRYMANTSDSAQSRVFTAWAIFLSILFDQLDLTPCAEEVLSPLPKDFCAPGFKYTVLLGDSTENWIASPENYDISSVTFSAYKNHDTGKTGLHLWSVQSCVNHILGQPQIISWLNTVVMIR